MPALNPISDVYQPKNLSEIESALANCEHGDIFEVDDFKITFSGGHYILKDNAHLVFCSTARAILDVAHGLRLKIYEYAYVENNRVLMEDEIVEDLANNHPRNELDRLRKTIESNGLQLHGIGRYTNEGKTVLIGVVS